MAKRKEEIERDTQTLIRLVTGFSEMDENFQLCVSYADSNFKYHRYLSPDSHKIHRAIEGLCEKFEVHSQKQKSVDLKELSDLFLKQTGLDGKETGQSDVHYAMLSLILNLTESPTKANFHRKQKDVFKEPCDNFDWKSYLLDGEDMLFVSYASSDSGDDNESLPETYDGVDSEDEEQRKKLLQQISVGSEPPEPLERSGDGEEQHFVTRPTSGAVEASLSVSTSDEYKELAHLLCVEYWKRKGTEEETVGSHAASNLARDWNYYQKQVNEYYTQQAQTIVTEHHVLREAIWMLSGVTELFIFKYDGKTFSLNPDVYLMHLTWESLESLLRPLMRKAVQVCVLQSFVNDIVSSSAPAGNACYVSQTYQAFASCVSSFLADFRKQLYEMEKLVMKQKELMSLERLGTDLQPWFARVQTVHGIYISGIAAVSSLSDSESYGSIDNCFKVSLLLNVLYQAVHEADLTTHLDTENKSCFLLNMLVKSSEPVIQITSDWINNGQLRDPTGEFIVQRNKESPLLNETFWEKGFVSNIQISSMEASMLDVNPENSNTQDDSRNSNRTADQNTSSRLPGQSGIVTHQADKPDFFIKLGPKLLQPILGDAILTGKSMAMLESLGRMGEVLDVGYGVYERPRSLYELFVRDLKSKLGTKSEDRGPVCATESSIIKPCQMSALDEQLNIQGERDTLLNINFAAVFPEISLESDGNSRHENEELLTFGNSDLSPLLRLCEGCLYPHVRSRYKTVCAKLVHILKTEYHLMECIHAMQRYYLMSSGEVMCEFYTPIFEKIVSREFWRDATMLEMYLHEAVAPRFPGDLSKLSVTLTSASNQKDKSPIGVTDCIQLKFKVPWPLDVVISGKCQKLYNDIFTFLLQIKRAKYSVDQLRFEDLSRHQAVHKDLLEPEVYSDMETMPRKTRIHRFQILRFRLLYFVNSLHNYIMTRILHSTGLEFASRLEEAADLEQIISIHGQYAEAIHERCLLHPKLSFLKEAVVSVLNMSLSFSMLWRQGVDFVSGDSVQEMDTELSRCVHFLSAFLNNVIKRGSFPHLESLAFALVSSVQHIKR